MITFKFCRKNKEITRSWRLRFFGKEKYCHCLATAVLPLVSPQDAPPRSRLRGPRGVSAAAAEPQRAGERGRPGGQDAAHDGSARRAPRGGGYVRPSATAVTIPNSQAWFSARENE